jgi:hypothetical protein
MDGTWQYLKLDLLGEGLGLTTLRLLWFPFAVWHSAIFRLTVWPAGYLVLAPLGWDRWGRGRVRGLFYLLIDVYILAWTLLVVWAYLACFRETAQARASRHAIGPWSLAAPALIVLWRLYELVSYIGGSHSQPYFRTLSIRRAIFNTAWHYGEGIVCFATIYLCISALWGDTFVAAPDCVCQPRGAPATFAGHWLDPLYFSAICVTTVGFGDRAPQTLPGKAAVMAQVSFGIFLLVIVVGRVLSSQEAVASARARRHRRIIIY